MHLTPAGGPHERRVRSLVIGRRASQQRWGVTAGKARHTSSNVRCVSAGKVDTTLVIIIIIIIILIIKLYLRHIYGQIRKTCI